MAQTFDVCIRGAGVVGRTLALLLARERLRVALVTPPAGAPQVADVRAYALNAASRALLESVRAWPDEAHATAVLQMQVQADQDGMVRFDAAQQGCDALTWIVDVPALQARLQEAIRYQPLVEQVTEPVAAALTVVCEGRASRTRAEFGVEFDITPYAQHAIATRLACERRMARWHASGLRPMAPSWRFCRWAERRGTPWLWSGLFHRSTWRIGCRPTSKSSRSICTRPAAAPWARCNKAGRAPAGRCSRRRHATGAAPCPASPAGGGRWPVTRRTTCIRWRARA